MTFATRSTSVMRRLANSEIRKPVVASAITRSPSQASSGEPWQWLTKPPRRNSKDGGRAESLVRRRGRARVVVDNADGFYAFITITNKARCADESAIQAKRGSQYIACMASKSQ